MEHSLRGVHMRRIFLRGMLGSLLIATVVAIVALLAAGFTGITWRILSTFFTLAIYCGLIGACAALREKRRNTWLSAVGALGFSACLALILFGVWASASGWAALEFQVTAWATSACFLSAWLLALPCERVLEAFLPRWPGLVGCTVIAATCAVWIMWLWDGSRFYGAERTVFVLGIISFALGHICFLQLTPLAPNVAWLRAAAIALVAATAGVWSLFVLNDSDDDVSWRLLGAVGIADAAATLGVMILSRGRRVEAVANLSPGLAQIDLSCPRCEARQTLIAGECACRECGLKFNIEVEESRCRKCDYPLWKLPQRRCPECGLAF